MMQRIITLLAVIGFLNCKEAPKEKTRETETPETAIGKAKTTYPEALEKVFNAHGGLENWKAQKTLYFEIAKPDALEKHTIDLHSRRDKIEISETIMGFDGKEIWLSDEKEAYTGNAVVYHNLMFYFYAMPFVFADPGINYETTEDLVFEGKSYPGIHISYDKGVGASPKDDYYLHYDPENYQMAWLGYTFTYGSDKKSDDVRWIRYRDWMKVKEVLLPEYLTWYTYEGRTIKEAKDPLYFENVSLDASSRPHTFYARPENAKVVLNP